MTPLVLAIVDFRGKEQPATLRVLGSRVSIGASRREPVGEVLFRTIFDNGVLTFRNAATPADTSVENSDVSFSNVSVNPLVFATLISGNLRDIANQNSGPGNYSKPDGCFLRAWRLRNCRVAEIRFFLSFVQSWVVLLSLARWDPDQAHRNAESGSYVGCIDIGE